jgi:hypothetical protein
VSGANGKPGPLHKNAILLPSSVGYRADGKVQSDLNVVELGLKPAVQMVQQRKRVRHRDTFEERLSKEAAKFKEAADKLPPGSFAREMLLRRVAQAETASNIDKWLSSKICGKAC